MGKGQQVGGWDFNVLSCSIMSVWLFATPWIVACRFLCPWDLLDPGMEPTSPALAGGFFTTSTTWLEEKHPSPVMTPGLWGGGSVGVREDREDPHWILTCAEWEEDLEDVAWPTVPHLIQLHLLLWAHHKRTPGTATWFVSGSENSSTEATSSL